MRGLISQKSYKEDYDIDPIPKEIYRNISKRNKIDQSDSEDSSSDPTNLKFIILPDNPIKSYFDMMIGLYNILI
jgi:hypothetical protein